MDYAMKSAKDMLVNRRSQLEAERELITRRHEENQGTTQSDFDELDRHMHLLSTERDQKL